MTKKEIAYVRSRIEYLKYRGINITTIAKEAGISKNTLYKFMKDGEISANSFWKLRDFLARKTKSIFMSAEDRKNTNTLTLSEFLERIH